MRVGPSDRKSLLVRKVIGEFSPSLCYPPDEHTTEYGNLLTRSGPSPNNGSAGTLTPDFPASWINIAIAASQSIVLCYRALYWLRQGLEKLADLPSGLC